MHYLIRLRTGQKKNRRDDVESEILASSLEIIFLSHVVVKIIQGLLYEKQHMPIFWRSF
jgi:hypothetical protein